MKKNTDNTVYKILIVITAINFFLAGLKIYAGISGDSLSLLGDGIDSGTDVISGILSFLAARLVSRPANHSFPYGFSRAETLATWLTGSFIFMIGFQLIIQSTMNLAVGSRESLPEGWLLIVVFVSVFFKLFMSWFLFSQSKKKRNNLLKATAINMRADVLLSLGVFVGIGSSLYTGKVEVDFIFAIAIGFWIIRSAYEIFKESFIELMDGLQDEELYLQVRNSVDSVQDNLNPHRMRIRQMAKKYLISLDIEVDGQLNVDDGHKIAQKVEMAIRNDLVDVYDVLVHVEPHGNIEQESFGVSGDEVHELSSKLQI